MEQKASTGGETVSEVDRHRRNSAFRPAWESLAHAYQALDAGDLAAAREGVAASLAHATRLLLRSRGLPPTTHVDLGTSWAVVEIVLGERAGGLAKSASDLIGLSGLPEQMLAQAEMNAARSAVQSAAALVALIESEVYR